MPVPRAPRRRSPCGGPLQAVSAAREASRGASARLLLPPPLHDYLLVAVLVEERRQRAKHVASGGTLGPGRLAVSARRWFRQGQSYVVRLKRPRGLHRFHRLADSQPVEDSVVGRGEGGA